MPRTRSASGSRRPASPAAAPARAAADPRQRRHALATALDERRPAGEEERHVGAEAPRPSRAARRRSSSAPHASSARVDGRRRVAASRPPSPAATRDPLLERGRRAAAAAPTPAHPAPTARARRRERAQDEVVGERPGVEPRDVERIAHRRAARRDAQPVGQAERDHHRVQLVEAVRPAADDRERQVELRRRQPDDRCQPPERVARSRTGGCASPIGIGSRRRAPRAAASRLPHRRASAAAGRA